MRSRSSAALIWRSMSGLSVVSGPLSIVAFIIRTYAVATTMWSIACGSMVYSLLPAFSLRGEKPMNKGLLATASPCHLVTFCGAKNRRTKGYWRPLHLVTSSPSAGRKPRTKVTGDRFTLSPCRLLGRKTGNKGLLATASPCHLVTFCGAKTSVTKGYWRPPHPVTLSPCHLVTRSSAADNL